MGLTHLPCLRGHCPRVETQYFGISRNVRAGHMVQTRQVGVYVPGEFPDPELKFW